MATRKLSKETIQPLPSGRRVAAVQKQDHKYIVQKMDEFESEIRSDTGSDPLQRWYSYIIWVEKTFPKGGRDGNLSSLVEKCLKKFKDCVKYHQDDRFLEIWSKFAHLSPSPVDVYESMFNEGIGSKKGKFYADWSWELEQCDNYKKAEQVFKKGLQSLDEELDKKWLIAKHNQFQTRWINRLLGSDLDGDALPRQPRAALTSSRGHGEHQKVNTTRARCEIKSDLPGVLCLQSDCKGKAANFKFAIFADENTEALTGEWTPPPSIGSARLLVDRERNREHDFFPGKRTSAKKEKASQLFPLHQSVPKLSFKVYKDDDIAQLSSQPNLVQAVSLPKGTSVRSKEHETTPVALFEDPDLMKKPMYCKHLVYMGGTEYSFEELRCLEYQRKRAKEDYDRLKLEISRQTQLLQQTKKELDKLRHCKASTLDEPLDDKSMQTMEPKKYLKTNATSLLAAALPAIDSPDSTKDLWTPSPTLNTNEEDLKNPLWCNKTKPSSDCVNVKEFKTTAETFCDEDHGSIENVACSKKRFAAPEVTVTNETFDLPSLELFAKAAPVASTPFHGRSSLPKEGSIKTGVSACLEAARPLPFTLHIHDEVDEPSESLAEVLYDFQNFAGLKKKKVASTAPVEATKEDAAELSMQLSCCKLDISSFGQCRRVQMSSSYWQKSLISSFLEPEAGIDVTSSPTEFNLCGGQSVLLAKSLLDQSLTVSMGAALQADHSQPHLEVSTIHEKRPLPEDFHQNPFSSELHDVLLSCVQVHQRRGYVCVPGSLPAISAQSIVTLEDIKFKVGRCQGQGDFGKVFKATRLIDNDFSSDDAELEAVLKVQKPAREWEFYVVSELQYRLQPEDRVRFMSIPRCYSYNNGTVFVYAGFKSHTLLDVCNAIHRIESFSVEPIALYFSIEMLRIADLLRQAQIIHADIKPKSFLLRNLPAANADCRDVDELCRKWTPCLQIVDFGIAIDMKLLPDKTCFTFSFDKTDLKCPEMVENKPWTYQLDCFGVAATSFALLHGYNIQMTKVNDRFSPFALHQQSWNGALWSKYFDVMLNIPSCQHLPELQPLRRQMEEYFFSKYLTSFKRVMANLMDVIHHHGQHYS